MKEQELEVKFLIANLSALAARLETEGAQLIQARIYEHNLRFDDAAGSLTRAGEALRLRQDVRSILTYKGVGRVEGEVNVRQEIEFAVSDLTAAQHFLEALGYQVVVSYEKYRTSYDLGPVHVVLDELPYGNFAEIEGPDAEAIQACAARLGLNWTVHSNGTYLGIFKRLQAERGLAFNDLTFANFVGIKITPQDLGLFPGDVG